MGGWFGSQPQCPIDDQSREWIDRRWLWLTERIGADRIRRAVVVLANPAFFPDEYDNERGGARRLLDRVCEYLRIDPATIEMSIHKHQIPSDDDEDEDETLGMIPQHPADAGVREVRLESDALEIPLILLTSMVRQLCRRRLVDQFGLDSKSPEAEDIEFLADLAAVSFGMGVILANAALYEFKQHSGATKSWKMTRHAYLTLDMLGYALALFARSRNEEYPAWETDLRPDVRSAFSAARRYLNTNRVVETEPQEPQRRSLDLNSHAVQKIPDDPVTDFRLPTEKRDSATAIRVGNVDDVEFDRESEPVFRRRRRSELGVISDRFDFVGRMVAKLAFAFFGGLVGFLVGGAIGDGIGQMLQIKELAWVGAGTGCIALAVLTLMQLVQRPK